MRKKKIYLSLIASVLGIAFYIATALVTSAHPPSQTLTPVQRNCSHIHVKGKVETEGGAGIPGVRLDILSSAVRGLPSSCVSGYSTYTFTDTNGNYDCLVFIKTDIPECRAGFDSVTIDRSQIQVTKDGYDFRPKLTTATVAPSD